MHRFKIEVTGTTDLIMHNGRLANPTDPATKEVAEAYKTYQRDKTDASFRTLSRAEFLGAAYYFEREGQRFIPYWPSDNFHTALKHAGAKIVKKGRATYKNDVAAAVQWDEEICPLAFAHPGRSAPQSAAEFAEDQNYYFIKGATVGGRKVMRTRPRLKGWAFETTGVCDTDLLDLDTFRKIAILAGQVVGIGDWRPERSGSYGKFTAEITDLGDYDPLAGA